MPAPTSKKFARLPEILSTGGKFHDDALKEHLEKIPGLVVTSHIPEIYTEAIIHFSYKGYDFATNNAYDCWRFFADENCPAEILTEITNHCKLLLGSFED